MLNATVGINGLILPPSEWGEFRGGDVPESEGECRGGVSERESGGVQGREGSAGKGRREGMQGRGECKGRGE